MGALAVKRGSFLDVLKTVGAGFLGVRRRKRHDEQTESVPVWQVIVAGLVGAAIFVVALILVVRAVVGGAGIQ
jgi:hypothetical protein